MVALGWCTSCSIRRLGEVMKTVLLSGTCFSLLMACSPGASVPVTRGDSAGAPLEPNNVPAATSFASVCGNGVCEPGESCSACGDDCGVCLQVDLLSPVDGVDVSGTLFVAAQVKTGVGSTGVARVEFYRDDNQLIGSRSQAPYELTIESSSLGAGAHSFWARAIANSDQAGGGKGASAHYQQRKDVAIAADDTDGGTDSSHNWVQANSIKRLADGNIFIQFAGVPANQYQLQATSDLSHWSVIATLTADATSGRFSYEDLETSKHAIRFYRARSIAPLFGAGMTTFFPATTSDIYFSDVDGDGKSDVVTPLYDHTVNVWLSNGDGTFGSKDSLGSSTPNLNVALASGETFIRVYDADGDGRGDLVAHTSDGNIYVRRSLRSGGVWSGFSTPVSSPTSGVFSSFADLNGDGLPDTVSTDLTGGYSVHFANAIFTQLGTGGGSFAPPVRSFLCDNGYNGGAICTVNFSAAGDLNGDGCADLITRHYSDNLFITVAANDAGLSPVPPARGQGPAPGCPIVDGQHEYFYFCTLDGTSQCGEPICRPKSRSGTFGAGSFDSDGTWVLQNGDGVTSSSQINIDLGSEYPDVRSLGDMDANGTADINAQFVNIDGYYRNVIGTYNTVFLSNGDGSFGVPNILYLPGESNVVVGDLDGDPFPDMVSLVTANFHDVSLYAANGDGTFQPKVKQTLTESESGIANACPHNANQCTSALADIDGDGKLDLVKFGVSTTTQDVTTYLRTSSGF